VNGGDKCAEVYYQQTCDITITGGDWTPIGNGDNYFAGIYDGGNYTISGIRISSTSDYQGLFGKVLGTTNQHRGYIQNIILENSTIAGKEYIGGIVGRLTDGHVKNCHVRSSVTVKAGVDGTSGTSSSNKNSGFGGVVGYFRNGTVTDCTSMATVNNGGHEYVQYFGGVIGYMDQSSSTATATDCFSYGMKAIGAKRNGTVTNAKRVYKIDCTDGSITLPDEVGDTDGFYFDGIGYYKSGVSVPLTVTLGEPAAGYALSVSYKDVSDHAIAPNADGEYLYTTTASNATVTAAIVPDPVHFSQSGDEYTIHTATGWGVFCDALQDNATYNKFSGKTVRIDDDIEVSRMAGSQYHDFCGTFDGQEHTLTFNYGTSDAYANDEYAAPFHYVSNAGSVAANFKNLHVAGDIYTQAKYAAGLIAQHWGTVNVENCRVSTVIHSSVAGDGTHGGFEAVNVGTLNITGCVFDGKLLSKNSGDDATINCGGFVGWHNGGTTNISNSLYAPATLGEGETEVGPGTTGQAPSATFGRNTVNSITNSYYTRTLGTEQGLGYSFDTTPVNIGTAGTAYSVSGITPYTRGLLYDGHYYMTPEAVSLADNAANDVASKNGYFADVTLTSRKLYKDGAWNTLCLPFDVALDGSPLAGAEARTLTSASITEETAGTTLNLTFGDPVSPSGDQGGLLTAGTPYIIRWTRASDYVDDDAHNIVSPTFSGVTIDATDRPFTSTDKKVTFRGTYAPIEWDTENTNILFLGTNNTLYYPQPKDGKNPSINACRAYFELNGITVGDPSFSVRSIVFNFDDSETTSIDHSQFTIDNSPLTIDNEAGAWYTLDGRKVNSPFTIHNAQLPKGIYIHGGRKVVIK
jgi:hypothetical protein